MSCRWKEEPNADQIKDFFVLLSLCHTAVSEIAEDHSVKLQAESPDEEVSTFRIDSGKQSGKWVLDGGW